MAHQHPYAPDQDALAMQQLQPLSGLYLPWSPYSIRPCHLVAVLNEIVIGNRSLIVECGSGVSTLYIGRLLRQCGAGHLLSVEHDAGWAALITDLLRREGLEDYVTLIHAPLQPSPFTEVVGDWYDTTTINKHLADPAIDLLLVDGPPAFTPQLQQARYPALPFFRPHLAAGGAVFLDDAGREGEQFILNQWAQMSGAGIEFVWPGLAKITLQAQAGGP